MAYVFAFDHPHDLPHAEVKALIGGKAANIAVMANELGLPVPPSFTISTEACRAYLAGGWPEGLDEEIREHMRRVETAVGRRFGDPTDPLLVSVRSGAPVSMPGMMDTILNLGLNDMTARGLAAVSGDSAFVDVCRDRFSTMYRQIVGVEVVPEDPWEQLRGAIEAVFRSWNCGRARSYRAREGIADDLGTGVTVQAMVFGNRGSDSATGVLFTRNPATGEPRLYGDILFDAQGEDVVAGTSQTEPIAVLDERMPAVAEDLRRYAHTLEHHFVDLCDIEFTIEQGRLWLLQVRIGKRSPQAALRIAVDMAEDDDFPLSRAEAVRRVARHLDNPPTTVGERPADVPVVTTGLAASPGVASGEIVTTPEDAVAAADAGRSVILVRRETSPDDVHGMARAVGILTSTGGLASHAAVVARGWGIPAVVGASAVKVGEGTISIGDRVFTAGDMLTIDGGSGEVFAGAVSSSATVVPEATKLLSWAQDLGIEIPASEEGGETSEEGGETSEEGGPSVDAVVRTLVIKGFVTAEGIASAFFTTEEGANQVLERMTADGLVESSGGMFQLTAEGKTLGRELIIADQESWGVENAIEALDAFLSLDHRTKGIVTAWQMREVDGRQVLNDHSDAAYDASVLAEFGFLHQDAAALLQSLSDGLPRLGFYLERLERAAGLVRGGDHRYIASPRVDSYHGVWFELHEDLILLAGRNRADEVAAGRA
ncbi:MAG: pyruvate, phosphate dikinase [Actinobacteria bacterium]|nr:pyruvate, phosphate dikinase [Actinomycetota bacterium]